MIRERYYRCYLIEDDRIVRPQDVFSYDNAGAIEQAEEILATTHYLSIEVWRGHECVATVNKAAAPVASDRDKSAHAQPPEMPSWHTT